MSKFIDAILGLFAIIFGTLIMVVMMLVAVLVSISPFLLLAAGIMLLYRWIFL